MILINRFLLIMLAFLIIALTLFAGWFGYISIINSPELSSEDLIYQAERFLFYSLITVVILITGFLTLLFRSIHVDRKLDRIIEMSRNSDIYPEKHFVGIGPLGERLKKIFSQINNLNIRKTLKISALSRLNEFIMNNITIPLLVTDVTGRILYSSNTFIEKLESTRADLIQKQIETFLPDLNVPTLMIELSRKPIPIEREANKYKFTCYPIHNISGGLNYVVFSADKTAIYTIFHKTGIESGKKNNTLASRMSRILTRKK